MNIYSPALGFKSLRKLLGSPEAYGIFDIANLIPCCWVQVLDIRHCVVVRTSTGY
jgi:hypothetical protein